MLKKYIFHASAALVALFFLVTIAASDGDMYTTQYDNVDIEGILKSKRLLKTYVNCIMGEGKCSDDGKFVRDNIDDMLLTNCSRCSPKQIDNAKKIIRHMVIHEPEYTKQFREKYDAEGKFWALIKEQAKKEGHELNY